MAKSPVTGGPKPKTTKTEIQSPRELRAIARQERIVAHKQFHVGKVPCTAYDGERPCPFKAGAH